MLHRNQPRGQCETHESGQPWWRAEAAQAGSAEQCTPRTCRGGGGSPQGNAGSGDYRAGVTVPRSVSRSCWRVGDLVFGVGNKAAEHVAAAPRPTPVAAAVPRGGQARAKGGQAVAVFCQKPSGLLLPNTPV